MASKDSSCHGSPVFRHVCLPMALCRLLLFKLIAAHHDFPGCAQPIFHHIASCSLFFPMGSGLGICWQAHTANSAKKIKIEVGSDVFLTLELVTCHSTAAPDAFPPPALPVRVVFGEGCLTQRSPRGAAGWDRATGLFFPELNM